MVSRFFTIFIAIGWELFIHDEDKFGLLFTRVIDFVLNGELTMEEYPTVISFFKYAFRVGVAHSGLNASRWKWSAFVGKYCRFAVCSCGSMFTNADAITS